MRLSALSILVPDYDAGIDFFTVQLGFDLLEDTDLGGGKRWVRVAPPQAETVFLLARAVGLEQEAAIGNQGGGRVWLFLETDDFARDHAAFVARGVRFEEAPRHESYGTVAVFRDPFGNRWDLIEFTQPVAARQSRISYCRSGSEGLSDASRNGCGCSSGVEHYLAKVRVVSSNLITRSSFNLPKSAMAKHSRLERWCPLRHPVCILGCIGGARRCGIFRWERHGG